MIAVALNILNRKVEALEHYERAMALALQSKSLTSIRFQRAQLASGYLRVGRFEQAATMLRAVLADSPNEGDDLYFQSYLAEALAGLTQWDAALAAADQSVSAARAPDKVDAFAEILLTRAAIRRDAGRRFVEPEHPSLWAPFVLIGQP